MLSFAPSLQHYSAIMKYISQPPLLLDVHIHKPLLPARTWMDSLLAFFPGLQVSHCVTRRPGQPVGSCLTHRSISGPDWNGSSSGGRAGSKVASSIPSSA